MLLSDVTLLRLPCLTMIPLSTRINESVSAEFVISMCTALLARHVNIVPHLFSSFLPSFLLNGPNMSTLQYVKWSKSVTLCLGSSDIFCVPNLPLRHLQITHLLMTLLVALFPHVIQKLEFLNWLSVIPLPEWPTLMWHQSKTFLGMMASFRSTIGWKRFSFYVGLFSVPPTLINKSSAIKGCNL